MEYERVPELISSMWCFGGAPQTVLRSAAIEGRDKKGNASSAEKAGRILFMGDSPISDDIAGRGRRGEGKLKRLGWIPARLQK
jgi:hypothetical protein